MKTRRLLLYLQIGLFVTLFLFLTIKRNNTWIDSFSLNKDVIAKSPGKVRPLVNLASAYINNDLFSESIPYLKMAIKIDPYYVELNYNFGIAYLRMGNYKLAEKYFKDTLSIIDTLRGGHFGVQKRPKHEILVLANLGTLLSALGKYEESITYLERALFFNPSLNSLRYNLALTYMKVGDKVNAVNHLEKILELDPGDKGASYNLQMLQSGL